jgi:hypothetical protein
MSHESAASARGNGPEAEVERSATQSLPRTEDTASTSRGATREQLAHTKAIRAHIEKGERAYQKAEEHYIAAGQHLKSLKELCANVAEWETLIKAKCNLAKTRAYELIQIADGRSSSEIRALTASRKAKHKAKAARAASSDSVPGTESAEPESAGERLPAGEAENGIPDFLLRQPQTKPDGEQSDPDDEQDDDLPDDVIPSDMMDGIRQAFWKLHDTVDSAGPAIPEDVRAVHSAFAALAQAVGVVKAHLQSHHGETMTAEAAAPPSRPARGQRARQEDDHDEARRLRAEDARRCRRASVAACSGGNQ